MGNKDKVTLAINRIEIAFNERERKRKHMFKCRVIALTLLYVAIAMLSILFLF